MKKCPKCERMLNDSYFGPSKKFCGLCEPMAYNKCNEEYRISAAYMARAKELLVGFNDSAGFSQNLAR